MSDRITGAMLTGATLNDLNSALAALQRSASELSSGKSILEPSDNPYGASRAIDLQSQLDGLSSYASSVQDGISWTNTARRRDVEHRPPCSSACANSSLQASNGTNNPGDLKNIAAEVGQLTETRQAGRQHPVRRAVRLLRDGDLDARPTRRAKATNSRATPKRSRARSAPAAR